MVILYGLFLSLSSPGNERVIFLIYFSVIFSRFTGLPRVKQLFFSPQGRRNPWKMTIFLLCQRHPW